MKIKGFFKDVGGANAVTKKRKQAFDHAPAKENYYDPIGEVAKKLHGGFITLKIADIKPASKTAKTIRFTSVDHIPLFKAGQCLSLVVRVGRSLASRPYSISSAPSESRGEKGFLEITVRKPRDNGFIGDYLYDYARIGDEFQAEVGEGMFYYEPLRDAPRIVAIAGGSGITPFLSMAREIKNGLLDLDLIILYGSVSEDDIVLRKELDKCKCDRVRIVHVLSGDNPEWKGKKGLIDRKLIAKYSEGDVSYFICGPHEMVGFVKGELEALNVPRRRIRIEIPGPVKDVSKLDGFPSDKRGKEFFITVCQGIAETTITARASEPIATALERAGMKIHTACRSGVCGHCRIKVLEGNYFVKPMMDGRRAADKDFNYVYACSTYPLGNMKIKINIE